MVLRDKDMKNMQDLKTSKIFGVKWENALGISELKKC